METYEFNVMDYGATGNGVADDTTAFQLAINAAIAKNAKLIIPPPLTSSGFYKITSTLIVKHPTNAECYMDLEAIGGIPRSQIRYLGANGTPCFQIIGLRFSIWSGLKIQMGNNIDLIAIDLDTNSLSFSTSYITFNNCHIALGTGTGQQGWRLGHISGGGADISCLEWNNCSVFGANPVVSTHIGWHIEGSNTLQNVWFNCFGSTLGILYSNKSGAGATNSGNGAAYFYGLGTSQNLLEFQIANSQSYVVSGGRFESGKRVLTVENSNVSPSIVFQGTEINDYHPVDGVLFLLDMPCSLKLDGVNIKGKKGATGVLDNNVITAYGGGTGVRYGRVIVDGGAIEATDPYYRINLNTTLWKFYSRGVGKQNSAGVCTGIMNDVSL